MGMYDFDMYSGMYGVDPDSLTQGALSVVFGILGAILAILFVVGVVCWIFQSIALCTIARRRKIYNAWLAWLPVCGGSWILGSISDQYQFLNRGKTRGLRHGLLWMELCLLILSVGFAAGEYFLFINGTLAATSTMVGLLILVPVVLLLLSIAMTIVWYVALYDLYRAANPNSAPVYLILSIFLPVCIPFFGFILRNDDQGILIRKDPSL